MGITRILLVRHGETTWNQQGRYQGQVDTPLSERGWAQGRQLAKALSVVKLDACYASPLSRAFNTAKLCAELHGLDVTTDERLLEIAHGEWEGMLADEVEQQWPELLYKWRTTVVDAPMPGGEAIDEVADRSMEAFNDIARDNEGKTVLVAAHDAVNKAVVCRVMGTDLSHFWQVKQDNTCINVLEWQNGVWRLVLLNSTLHMGYLFSGIEQKGL